jgi:hypothetical protein
MFVAAPSAVTKFAFFSTFYCSVKICKNDEIGWLFTLQLKRPLKWES